MATNIIDIPASEQYKKDSLEYAAMVNKVRQIPDGKDGLKTIHRRILTAMYFDLPTSRKSHIKSAKVVGEVMGNYHPHGDTPIYQGCKPMANWFESKLPMIDPQGNWGSFLGDRAAAYRYTEMKLSQFGMECVIGDLKETKNAVDWLPNFDNTRMQPEFMAVTIPNLLINGAFGIGYGIKTVVPQHNVGEVIDATINLIKHPNAQVVLIPDHCMPVEIIDTNFKKICNMGHGSYTARSIVDIEDYKGGRKALVIKSIPDMVFFDPIVEKIADLIKEKKITQISDIIPENTDNELRVLLILKRGADAEFVRQTLYLKTQLQKSYTVNFEVLNGVENVRMSYKAYLQNFIEFRRLTKFRVYCNRLQTIQTRYHRIEAYVKALKSGDIDNILNMIRKQKTVDDKSIIEYLIKKLKITDMQASYIINAPNKTLSIGYLKKYEEELTQLTTDKYHLTNIVLDGAEIIDQEIIQELRDYKKKYSSPRTSKVIDVSQATNVPKGNFKVIITENNFIKKIPDNNTSIGSFKNDSPKFFIRGCNTENILLFNNMGKVFKLPIHKIPISEGSSNGVDIRQLIKNSTADLINAIYEPNLKEMANKTSKYFVTIVTRSGLIKKIDINDLLTVQPSGIIYTKLDKADKVVDIKVTGLKSDVVVYSDFTALRIPVKDIPHQRRITKGVRSMPVGESIDGLSVVIPKTEAIVVVTDKGYLNRIDSVALPPLGRNKAGSNVIKLKRGDRIKSIIAVNEKDNILVRTKHDSVTIPVGDVPVGSSVSAGTKMLSLKGDNILRVSKKKDEV